jgi:hypothetical protein
MRTLLIEPPRADDPGDCARYERVVSSLRDEGWEVRISRSRSERNSAVAELVVRLLDEVPSDSLDSLEAVLAGDVRESLPRGHKHHGRVVIYGPAGEVLRIREVPARAAA